VLETIATAMASGASLCATGASAGPLVTAIRPQQSRAEGNDTGSWQWCVQQATARISAAATPGFT
jgi:hypothetical protein